MDKKENKIGQNLSSGAKKVENISNLANKKTDKIIENMQDKEKDYQKEMPSSKRSNQTTATTKKAKPKKIDKGANKTKTSKKALEKNIERTKKEKEDANAKKRVDTAILKEERKARKAELKSKRKLEREERRASYKNRKAERKAKRKEMQAKRKADRAKKQLEIREKRMQKKLDMKEKRAEQLAEKRAKRQLIKSETSAQKAKRIEKERAAKLAIRKEKQQHVYNLKMERKEARLKKREQKILDRQHKRENKRPAYGGWLAAVISLGVVTLILTTIVTYGAIDIVRMNNAAASGYRATFYELVGVMDDIDEDLNRVRVSNTSEYQGSVLSDIYAETQVAESVLEKFPISMDSTRNITSFINRTSETSRNLLNKLYEGENLDGEDMIVIENLYETNHSVRATLDELSIQLNDKDMTAFMKKKEENRLNEAFKKMEETTTEKQVGENGPFTDTASSKNEKEVNITSLKAEELCQEYFEGYDIEKIEYCGETLSDLKAYNFRLWNKDGKQYYAEVSEDNGALVGFDSYEQCKEKNFNEDQAKQIAEDFLKKVGYENMTAVWLNVSGTQATFTFVYEENGVAYYPDSIKIRVCETKGKVVGFTAVSFLKNHKVRPQQEFKLNLSEAKSKLSDKLKVESAKKAIIPIHDKDVLTYEFLCTRGENAYFVYVNALTGVEESILTIENSMQGRYLR